MSASSLPPEGQISAENRRDAVLSIVGIACTAIPTLAAIIYLVIGLSFSEQSTLYRAQANNALQQRVDLIESDIAAITRSLEKMLAGTQFEQRPESVVQLIPGSHQLQIIPLGDMGVASLDPADYGLTSLILLDRVRKTFETGAPGFEIIKQGDALQLVVVGRFSTRSQQGVAIAALHDAILERWVSKAAIGQFNLWQTFEDSPSIPIAASSGRAIADSAASFKRDIKGAPYVLGLDIDPSLMPTATALPFIFWPLIVVGLFASYWILAVRRRSDLEDDVKLILNTADSRDRLILRHANLSPLAFTIRQLASNNRNQMRRTNAQLAQPMPDQNAVEPTPSGAPAQKAMVTEWSIRNGSWVTLTKSDSEKAEHDALKKLAVGIAGLAARSATRSFIVSCLGGDAEIQAKTCLIKALLSEGVDVIDVGDVTPPVTHMSTHNGTSSGAALMIQRDMNSALTVGALYNRQWAGEVFWQKVTVLANEHIATSSNGRSIKLQLTDDYCDRLSSDMAMAEQVSLSVVCDNPNTLAVAKKSLSKAACEVHAVCLQPGFKEDAARLIFKDNKAKINLIVDSQASRLTVFDEHANRVRDDHIFMLMSRDALARHPGSDVIVGHKSSRALPSFVTSCGGASKMVNSTPHALQREMSESGAVIGGDCNGVFYLRDRWFGSDDAIYAAARLAEIVSNEGALTDLVAKLPETSLSVLSLNSEPDLHAALLVLLSDEANFAGARLSQTDGMRVDFADSWVHIDSVGCTHEPTLRIEGDDESCRNRLEELIADFLSQQHPGLALPMSLPTLTTPRKP